MKERNRAIGDSTLLTQSELSNPFSLFTTTGRYFLFPSQRLGQKQDALPIQKNSYPGGVIIA
jgi:hypothetical protein